MAKLNPEQLDQARLDAQGHADKGWIKVGMSTCGIAAGAEATYKALLDGCKERELDVVVEKCGCLGMCYAEPMVEIDVPGVERTVYGQIDAVMAERLLDSHVCLHRPVKDWVVGNASRMLTSADEPAAIIGPQQYRIVLRNCGQIDPDSIEQYIAADGYQALKKCLTEMTPEQVIEAIKESGLRGRGGAGFPTGLKWQFTRAAEGQEKFVICNADEGDPGAYMDRSVLEGDPHSVIEGMAIAAYAIGATSGFFYIRAEYPLAIDRVENALRQAKRFGVLGKKILGTDFSFDLDVRLGAGAFVCGEETALIASIEGQRGTPRPRPPYPSVRGLWGMPTSINNVETLANIAPIIQRGPAWFASIGTDKSKGTKVFAVTGKVQRSGLVEIPMGMTLRQIVEEIAGGVGQGKTLKAVQTGGPSGGVIPDRLLDTPVSYEHLQQLGSIMGSGGMIVMDQDDSMIDIAKFYLGFCVEESCGKCAPCRIGGKQMLRLLERLASGQGGEEDIVNIHRIATAMRTASLCALGQTAPNPVLSTLNYFEPEYAAATARPEPAQA